MAQTNTVMVGLSGGVDSAVAAYLLQKQGWKVQALFMKNWEEDDDESHCATAEDLQAAQDVCEHLNLALHAANFSAQYWQRVFKYFLAEIEAGRTPNPDIVCNKEIKFHVFPDYIKQFGATCMATGHYVRCAEVNGELQLLKGVDPDKDQSYFLYSLNQDQLRQSMFPIGAMLKSEVRRLAEKIGLPNSARRDSTGICFIGERKFREFLQHFLPAQPGPICTPEGKQIGEHQGVFFYTIGQRKGLGIGGKKDTEENAWYVCDKDIANNTLVVVQGHQHPMLLSRGLRANQVHWVSDIEPPSELSCMAKTRYRQADQPCRLRRMNHSLWEVLFQNEQRAVTPGQSVVFYQGERCLGGGIIESIIHSSERICIGQTEIEPSL